MIGSRCEERKSHTSRNKEKKSYFEKREEKSSAGGKKGEKRCAKREGGYIDPAPRSTPQISKAKTYWEKKLLVSQSRRKEKTVVYQEKSVSRIKEGEKQELLFGAGSCWDKGPLEKEGFHFVNERAGSSAGKVKAVGGAKTGHGGEMGFPREGLRWRGRDRLIRGEDKKHLSA